MWCLESVSNNALIASALSTCKVDKLTPNKCTKKHVNISIHVSALTNNMSWLSVLTGWASVILHDCLVVVNRHER